jgi:ABC-type lipoprotein release transport system permease subunit
VRRFVGSQLRHRPGRALALAAGLLVAAVSFVLLTSAARSGELKVAGSVRTNFRPAYDVLVRPKGSATQLELSRRLVRDNYLSGIFGGISLKQYDQIKRLSGVAVAAPIANTGYILPFADLPISIGRFLNRAPQQLYRIRLSWLADDGTSNYPGGSDYVYVNRSARFTTIPPGQISGALEQLVPGQGPLPVCGGLGESKPQPNGPFDPVPRETISCFSTRSPEVNRNNFFGSPVRPHGAGFLAEGNFPILVAAIDPVEEQRLVDLKGAVVEGRYLSEADRLFVASRGVATNRYVPVLVSDRSYVRERLQMTIERLRVPSGVRLAELLSAGTCRSDFVPCPAGQTRTAPVGWPKSETAYRYLNTASGTVVGRLSVPMSAIYNELLGTGTTVRGLSTNNTVSNYWTVSPTRYRQLGPNLLQPKRTTNPPSVFNNPLYANGLPAPPDDADTQFRKLTGYAASNGFLAGNVYATPSLAIVGRYDPAKLPGFSPLSRVPLETYYPPLLQPATPASKEALHGQPLAPSQNLGGYIQQPPLVLTTLKSLPAFTRSQYFAGPTPANRNAPISVIRVRVAGVTGPNPHSQALIRSVALRIHNLTGLDVDITAGSSPHPLTVDLPAGKFGRPALALTEGWVKKGVSVAFLNGVDRKQLALFALIPLLCCFFVANGVYAAARTRRSEIGTLLTLGWTQRAIFVALLGEILLIAVAAGVAGTGIAAILVAALTLHASLLLTLLVIPVSLILALAAGLIPAWRTSQVEPLEAIRPAISRTVRGHRIHHLAGLALVNLRRVPSRTVVGAAGLALGTAALTLLLAVEWAFQGVLSGTLLGDSVAVQIRGYDYLAVALVIALAALSVADVLYLNLRDRRAELVTLRTLGWANRHLATVVLSEAATIGIGGSLIGAAAGTTVAAAVLAVPITSLVLSVFAAVGGSLLAALLASSIPIARINRLTPPTILAAEI